MRVSAVMFFSPPSNSERLWSSLSHAIHECMDIGHAHCVVKFREEDRGMLADSTRRLKDKGYRVLETRGVENGDVRYLFIYWGDAWPGSDKGTCDFCVTGDRVFPSI